MKSYNHILHITKHQVQSQKEKGEQNYEQLLGSRFRHSLTIKQKRFREHGTDISAENLSSKCNKIRHR